VPFHLLRCNHQHTYVKAIEIMGFPLEPAPPDLSIDLGKEQKLATTTN
jgi:hypothetical protein